MNLLELPDYHYKEGVACPECYKPVTRGRKDARCDECLHDKTLFPVNYRRRPKKKSDDDEDQQYGDEEERPRRRRRERDE